MDKPDNIDFDFSDLDLCNLSIDTVEVIQANDSTGFPAHAASCHWWLAGCSSIAPPQ